MIARHGPSATCWSHPCFFWNEIPPVLIWSPFGVERTHPDLIISGGIEKILVHPIWVVGAVELDSLSDRQGHFSLLSDSVRLADGDSLLDLFWCRRFDLSKRRRSGRCEKTQEGENN